MPAPSQTAFAPGDGAPDRLRIASYNICKGRFLGTAATASTGRSVVADVASCAGLRAADVLLVQEAVVGALRRGDAAMDSVATLAAALGLATQADTARQVRFVGAPQGHAARWGVAVLSRYPARFHDVALPRPRWSPWARSAVLAEIGAFIVGTFHLEVWPIGAPARRRQIATVLEALAGLPSSAERPVVLAGDFNCERGAPHHLLQRAGFTAVPTTSPTWSLAGLRLRLDHTYVRGVRVVAAGVERDARGSDHRPVWADVEVAVSVPAAAPARLACAFQTRLDRPHA